MRESMETFVRGPGNAEAVRALESLSGLRPIPSKLYIEGPRHAGKSTLVRSWAADAERGGAGEAVFACSGADIAMALQFEADGTFFEKLGATPILLVDDLGPFAAGGTGRPAARPDAGRAGPAGAEHRGHVPPRLLAACEA